METNNHTGTLITDLVKTVERVRTFQQADCPKCGQRITVEVLGLKAEDDMERDRR